MPFWQQCLAMATLLLFMAWIYVLAGLMLAAPFSPLAAAAVILTWGTLMLPCTPVLWRPALASPVFALWRKYFNYSVVYEEKLDNSQHYLYADFPHGAQLQQSSEQQQDEHCLRPRSVNRQTA
jgi:hypothetical protein